MQKPEFLINLANELNGGELSLVSLLHIYPTGSRYICDPPPMDTDEDWIVFPVEGYIEKVQEALALDGWVMQDTLEDTHYDDCLSYRKGHVNVILIMHQDYYTHWLRATEICKALNILDKTTRKLIHRINCGEMNYE